MVVGLAYFLLPPLFVFGVYHLLTWFNVLRINGRVFWKRVAMTSGVCHVLLASGYFAFSYFDAAGADSGKQSGGLGAHPLPRQREHRYQN